MATHSNILAWRIPQRSGGSSPQGCEELDLTERLNPTPATPLLGIHLGDGN